jgi:hypothetical protein
MLRFYVFCEKKFGVVECGFYWGYLLILHFSCGEVVVNCVAKLVERMSFGMVLKVGQGFEVYFLAWKNLVGVQELGEENDGYGRQYDEQGDTNLHPQSEGGHLELQSFDPARLLFDGEAS